MEIRELSAAEAMLRFDQVIALYKAVAWSSYTSHPTMLRSALQGSLAMWTAFEGADGEGEKLIGLVRVVGDGTSIVFVQDLLVSPEFQRRGVGTQLLQRALERYAHVYQTELLTDDTEKTCAFYESLGFVPAEKMGCRSFVRIGRAPD